MAFGGAAISRLVCRPGSVWALPARQAPADAVNLRAPARPTNAIPQTKYTRERRKRKGRERPGADEGSERNSRVERHSGGRARPLSTVARPSLHPRPSGPGTGQGAHAGPVQTGRPAALPSTTEDAHPLTGHVARMAAGYNPRPGRVDGRAGRTACSRGLGLARYYGPVPPRLPWSPAPIFASGVNAPCASPAVTDPVCPLDQQGAAPCRFGPSEHLKPRARKAWAAVGGGPLRLSCEPTRSRLNTPNPGSRVACRGYQRCPGPPVSAEPRVFLRDITSCAKARWPQRKKGEHAYSGITLP